MHFLEGLFLTPRGELAMTSDRGCTLFCSSWTWAGIPTHAAACSCRPLTWWRKSEAGSVPLAPSSSPRCPSVTPSWPSGKMVVPLFSQFSQVHFSLSSVQLQLVTRDHTGFCIPVKEVMAVRSQPDVFCCSFCPNSAQLLAYMYFGQCIFQRCAQTARFLLLIWYFFLPVTARWPLSLLISHCQRLQFTRLLLRMRRPLSVQHGNSAGSSCPERETLSSCLSLVSLANTSCWPCWSLPAKDDACLCWVRVTLQTLQNEQIFISALSV